MIVAVIIQNSLLAHLPTTLLAHVPALTLWIAVLGPLFIAGLGVLGYFQLKKHLREKYKKEFGAQLEAELEESMLEMRMAYSELQEKEGRSRLAYYTMAAVIDMAFWLTKEGRFHEVNDATCRALGLTKEQLLGMYQHEVNSEVDEERWGRIWEATKAAGSLEFETLLVNSAGKEIPVEVSANYVYVDGREYVCVFARDITERREREEALKRSEERFRSYFELGLVGMAVLSRERRWMDLNPKLCEILGLNRPDLMRLRWEDVTHESDWEDEAPLLEALINGEEDTYTLDKRFVQPDGTIAYAMVGVRCIRNKDGKVDHILAMVQDVTDRHLAEEARRASEEKFFKAFEMSPDAIVISDHRTAQFLEVSQGFTAITGYKPEEVKNISLLELDIWVDLEERAAMIKQYEENNGYAYLQARFRRKDGQIFVGELAVREVDMMGGSYMLSIVRDTTERDKAERALQDSERRLTLALDAGQYALWDWHIKYPKGSYFSPNFYTILGYMRDSIQPSFERWIDLVHPDEQQRVESALDAYLNGELPGFDVECRMRHADGHYLWTYTKGKIFEHDENGFPLRLVGVVADITDRKTAELELAESNRKFSTLIANLPGSVYRYHYDTPINWEFISVGCLELTGYSEEEFYKKGFDWMALVHPHDAMVIGPEIKKSLDQRVPYQLTYRINTKEGKQKWIWEQGRGIYNQRGKLMAAEGFMHDITDRKQAEQELIESYKDRQALVNKQNKMLEEMVRERTDDLQKSKDRLEALLQETRHQSLILETQKDELRKNLVTMEHQRKEVEEARSRFELLHKGSSEGLWDIYYQDGQLDLDSPIWLSDIYRKMVDFRGDKALGFFEGLLNEAHDDDHFMLKEKFDFYLLSQNREATYFETEFRFGQADEELRWFKIQGTTLRDENGVPLRSVGSLRDVTDKKRLQHEIDRLMVRYNLAFRSTTEGIWDMEFSVQGNRPPKVWWSDKVASMWGVPYDNEVNNWVELWASRIHPDDLHRATKEFMAFIKDHTGKFIYDSEYRVVSSNKKDEKWFRAVGAALRDENGYALRIAGVVSDITAQKELIRLKENLQLEVEKQTKELQMKQIELSYQNEELSVALQQLKDTQSQLVQSEKLASLGQLTAGIAHEINNPINFVYAGANSLEKNFQAFMKVISQYDAWTKPLSKSK